MLAVIKVSDEPPIVIYHSERHPRVSLTLAGAILVRARDWHAIPTEHKINRLSYSSGDIKARMIQQAQSANIVLILRFTTD